MEHGTIEREIRIDASPDVVYEVLSTPEHLREWWPDEASLDAVPGGTGRLAFGNRGDRHDHVAEITVVEADPPRRFSFRWVYDDGVAPAPGNSLLVTFDLVPQDSGTLLQFREEGFRERGWEAAVLEEAFRDHTTGWDHFLPRLEAYVDRLVAQR